MVGELWVSEILEKKIKPKTLNWKCSLFFLRNRKKIELNILNICLSNFYFYVRQPSVGLFLL